MNIKGLSDLKGAKKDPADDKEKRTTYAGGEKSGLLLEDKGNRGEDLVAQARRNQGASTGQHHLVITLYANGILVASLDRFFPFGTPEGDSLHRDLREGRVPEALADQLKGDADVALEDKRTENYERKEEKRLFQGEGVVLGGSGGEGRAEGLKLGDLSVRLADNSPVHALQVKFPNGERKVLQVNPETPMAAVRAAVEGQLKTRQFRMTTPLPVRDLTAESRTLGELDLLDSAINVAFI